MLERITVEIGLFLGITFAVIIGITAKRVTEIKLCGAAGALGVAGIDTRYSRTMEEPRSQKCIYIST